MFSQLFVGFPVVMVGKECALGIGCTENLYSCVTASAEYVDSC